MRASSAVAIFLFAIMECSYANGQVTFIPLQSLPAENGPVFQTQYEGIAFSGAFPHWVKDLDSLDLTLEVINKTQKNFVIHDESGCLRGFDFHLFDALQRDVEATEMLKDIRKLIPSSDDSPEVVDGDAQTTILKAGIAMVMTLPLKEYVPIRSVGKYILRVDWRDTMLLGKDEWRPVAKPRLQFGGMILIKQSEGGISISPAN